MNKLKKYKSGSKIEWTEETWNPVVGCHKISDGCKNCYAEKMHKRHYANPQQPKYTKPFNEVFYDVNELKKPFNWNKPKVIFVCSMSDLFNKDVPDEFIKKVFDTMNNTHHQYQVLTKRSDRLKALAPQLKWTPNIWAGVTVESSKHIDRIDDLKHVPAQIKYLSIEPLIDDLGEVDLNGIDWVIAGGESGNSIKKLRPIKIEWVNRIRNICAEESIPFFFKQWGRKEFNPDQNDPTIPKKEQKSKDYLPKGGHLIDGKKYNEMPEIEEYFGAMIIPELKTEIEELDQAIHDSIKSMTREWITIGESLAKIQEKIEAVGSGKRFWQTYLGVNSFEEYCKTKLEITRQTATQMRLGYNLIKSLKPELLESENDKIPSYTKLRAITKYSDKITANPGKYSNLVESVFESDKTRDEIQKEVRLTFPVLAKSIVVIETVEYDEINDWDSYIEDFEEEISRNLKSIDQNRFKNIIGEIREMLNLE
jgi:protein gp37